MAGRPKITASKASDELAPSVFVRQVDDETWEIVERESGEVLSTHAKKLEALDAALAALGSPLKAPMLKSAETHEDVGVWRWHDATAEEPEDAALDDEGEVVRLRITRAAIESMAARLNESAIPKPVDSGNALPRGFLPSEEHGSAYSGGTLANGWSHAAVPWVDSEDRMHLALRMEVLPEVAREMDRGRLAFGSVHVEGDGVDDTGAIEGAELESHALTNRPVVQGLVPSSAMLTRDRRAVVTLRSKGSTTMKTKKAVTLKGPALDALTKICAELGVAITDEMDGDSYMSPVCDRIRALKQIAIGEQTLEALPAGGEPAEMAASRVKAARVAHLKRVALALAEGTKAEPATDDTATKAIAVLQDLVGAATPEDALAWLEANADGLKNLAAGETEETEEDAVPEGAPPEVAAAKSKKELRLALTLALKKLESRGDDAAALVEADIAAGKIATADREAYVELAKSNPKLYATLTKNARAVPTDRVAKPPTDKAPGKPARLEMSEAERWTVRQMMAATPGLTEAKALAKVRQEET
jgi:hypothetical protein